MVNNPLIVVEEALKAQEVQGNALLLKMKAVPAQFNDSVYTTIYQYVGVPSVNIGDQWAYVGSSKELVAGQIKGKKITSKIEISEDEKDAIAGAAPIANTSILDQKVRNQAMKDSQTLRFLFGKLTTNSDPDHDKEAYGAFGLSSDGTLSNPSDLNPTAGTEYDLTGISFGGTNISTDALGSMTKAINTAFLKQDWFTKQSFANLPKTIIVNSYGKNILDSFRNKAATNVYDQMTYTERLKAMGFDIVIDDNFDNTDATGEDGVMHMVVVGGLNQFELRLQKKEEAPMDVAGQTGDKQTISTLIRAKNFVACKLPILPLKTSATADYSLFKPVFIVKFTGYNNA